MKIEMQTLDEWAQCLYQQNRSLLHVGDFLRRSEAPDDVVNEIETARASNWRTLKALVHAGASDPLQSDPAASRQEMRDTGHALLEPLSLSLLSSTANRTLPDALRAAQKAGEAVDGSGEPGRRAGASA